MGCPWLCPSGPVSAGRASELEPRAPPPLPGAQAWAAGAPTLQGGGQTVRSGFLERDTELMLKESLSTRGLAIESVSSNTVPDRTMEMNSLQGCTRVHVSVCEQQGM